MTNYRRLFIPSFALSALVLVLLSGCASVPNIDADTSAKTRIKRIACLEIHDPSNVEVVNMGGAAGAFGIVGGLIQGVTNADHSKELLAVMQNRHVSLSKPLLAEVSQVLKDDGFAVNIVSNQRPKIAADGRSDDYSDIHVDDDAILSVWYGVVGYISSPYSTHYEPWVLIKIRLVDAKTKKDIYFKTICVGYKAKIENVVYLQADPRYRYASFDDLMSHSDDAIAGLMLCENAAAKKLGADLAAQ